MTEEEWWRLEADVLVDDADWLVFQPFSMRAVRHVVGDVDWCIAVKERDFWDYYDAGGMLLFHSKATSKCWLLHPAREEFRDSSGKEVSWRGFLMKYPGVAVSILEGFAEKALLA